MTDQHKIRIAETALAIIGASLVLVLVVWYIAPPWLQAMADPLIQLMLVNTLGFQVWQFVIVVLLAIGSWLLFVDIRSVDQR